MVNCDATLSTTYSQGQVGAILWWKYVDNDTGAIIDPIGPVGRLFDPNNSQRDPANTANTTSSTFTPLKDTMGTITGVVGAYYLIATFDNGATTGKWYIQTTFTWEGNTRTQNICFFVLTAGAAVSTSAPIASDLVYCDVRQVQDFMMATGFFDAQSVPSEGVIQQYIRLAQGDFEGATGTAFRPVFVQDEVHDFAAMREQYYDFPDYDFLPHPIKLDHYPLIVPFDPSRGHRLEIYEGSTSATSASDPVGRWTDWITTRTYGRNRDYDYDRWAEGEIRVRKFMIRMASAVRLSYEYGKPITTVSGDTAADSLMVPVVSTFRYQTRGTVRLATGERVFHTGKTPTSLTGCIRGYEGTEAMQIPSGCEVYEVPDDVNRLAIIRASMRLLQNDTYTAKFAEGQLSSLTLADRVRDWTAEWKEGLSKYQRWGLV